MTSLKRGLAGLAVVALACSAACTGRPQAYTSVAAHPPPAGLSAEALTAALPPFPGNRQDSGVTTSYIQNGNGFVARDANGYTADTGTSEQFAPPAGKVAWAEYRFNLHSDEPRFFTLAPDIGASGIYLGVADYAAQRWRFSGPFAVTGTPPPPIEVPLDLAVNVSPQGNLYFIVAVAGPGAAAVIETVQVMPHAWVDAVPEPDTATSSGLYPSLTQVDGQSAVAYIAGSPPVLSYVREKSDGTGWTTPVAVDDANGDVSLAVVAGLPDIAYVKASTEHLNFVRALDKDGNAWGNPVEVSVFIAGSPSLAVVGGKPAISFVASIVGGTVQFAVNAQADGSGAWTINAVDMSELVAFEGTSLLDVGSGVPGISFCDNGHLAYAFNLNADGSGPWVNVTVDSSSAAMGYASSLALVGDNPGAIYPAISYYDSTNTALKYAHSDLPPGADGSWTSKTVDNSGSVGWDTSLAFVHGHPAIAYYDASDSALSYVRSLDANGAAWAAPLLLDLDGDPGRYNSLALIGGSPAVAYYAQTDGDLRYTAMQ